MNCILFYTYMYKILIYNFIGIFFYISREKRKFMIDFNEKPVIDLN